MAIGQPRIGRGAMTDRSPAAIVERRRTTLRALDPEPQPKATLLEAVDVSRSTLDRSLRELSTVGFAASTTAGYRLTPLGRLALDEHDRRVERIGAIADAASLFEGVDLQTEIAPGVFDGATLVESTPHAPYQPVDRVTTLIETATHVSAYSARFLDRHASLYHDRIVEDAMTGTFVTTDRVLDRIAETRPDDLRESVALGRVGVRRTDHAAPITLVLAETPDGPEMGLVVYRDDTPLGFVGNDDPAATRWARAYVDRLWTAGTPFDPT
ncbi:helix-turn-helix transcriptional regulator [Haloplanus halobius]|uniref:helix-turn-helix transcriptional regulator n=1 Tax=Haloplanus halobius TaxID=2934938 RepID=UPI00200F90A0|nr:hypothetical protein [Haloplanus sp. XH21]